MTSKERKAVALETAEMIARAYDAPSMGYMDDTDWESVILMEQAEKYGMSEDELSEAVYDLEHSEDECGGNASSAGILDGRGLAGFVRFQDLKEHLASVMVGQGDEDPEYVNTVLEVESPEELGQWLALHVGGDKDQAVAFLIEAITYEFWSTWGRPE